MSDHKVGRAGEFLRNHKNAEIGTAVGVVAALVTTQLIRQRRHSESTAAYTAADVSDVKAKRRRASDDSIDFSQENFYRQQLEVFRHKLVHPVQQKVLLSAAAQVYKATHEEQAGSITFSDLRARLDVPPVVLEKALGRLGGNGVILYREENPKEGHVAGFIDSGVLRWGYYYGSEDDAPGLHDTINGLLTPDVWA